MSLIGDPPVIFLDEPTTGLDPLATREVHGLIESLRERGVTIFLTTHYMQEAEKLCKTIGIINHGRIVRIARTTIALMGWPIACIST